MNINISKPSKIIEIKAILKDRAEDIQNQVLGNRVRNTSEILNIKTLPEHKILNSMGTPAINFYEIDSDNFKMPLKKSPVVKSEIEELLKERRLLFEEDETKGVNKFNSLLDSQFIKTSLMNDLRVMKYEESTDLQKSLNYGDKNNELLTISVHFYTTSESISFYRQYYHFIEMTFKNETEMNIFSGFTLNEFLMNNQFHPIETFKCAYPEKQQDVFTAEEDTHASFSADLKTEPETLDEFETRVNYFNKMKGMYSKSEIKKISNFIENENFETIFLNIKELCVGSASNIIIQEMVKHISDDNLCRIIKSMGSDIAAISATKYGAYSVQTIIMSCQTKRAQDLVLGFFGNQGKFLLCHDIGNYSVQRILLFNEDYVYGLFKNNLQKTIENQLGMKVFKRCLELLKNKTDEINEDLKKLKFVVSEATMKELEELIKIY